MLTPEVIEDKKDILEKADIDWKLGKNPDGRYIFIPGLSIICANPKKILDVPNPTMSQILNNKEGSENKIKRIFDWFLCFGEFQHDAGPGEVKYPDQGFINTRVRERDGWHWATLVLVQQIEWAKKIVKTVNKYFYSKKVIALYANNFDDTKILNREIKDHIENGYHVIVVSCGKYCEGSTLPEVMYALDLTDGDGYDRAFQFATRVQSSFYGYKNIFIEDADGFVKNNRRIFFKQRGFYITLSPSKHMSMVINSNNIVSDFVNGHYETILNKIRNKSFMLGYDVDIMDMDHIKSYIRENYYGARLEGNLRARLNDISFDLSGYADLIKKIKKSNAESKKTEKRNRSENSNESNYILDSDEKQESIKSDKERENMIEMLYFFIRKFIEFIKDDFDKDMEVHSFNEMMDCFSEENFENFFDYIPKSLVVKWIENDILGMNNEGTEAFFANIYNLYKTFGS